MKKKLFSNIDKKWKEYALAGCVCILFFLIVSRLGVILGVIGSVLGVFKTVFIGAVIAYIMNPLAVLFEKKLFKNVKKDKMKWALSVTLTFIVVLIFFFLIGLAIIPQTIQNTASFIDNIDTYVANLVDFAAKASERVGPIVVDFVANFTGEGGLVNKVVEYFKENPDILINATSNVGTTAANWLIGLVFALYFLMAKDSFKKGLNKLIKLLLPLVTYANFIDLADRFNKIFSKYIVCQLIDSLIIGFCNYAFMLIMKMPDAAVISMVAAFTNLIPTFGPIIGAGIAVFILLLVKPISVLPFLIFTVVIQLCDSYVIKPKLFGGALNVPGVFILVAIIVFGKAMGVTGMLLAIPFAAILVYIYTDLFIPWLELRQDLKKYNKETE